MSDAPERIWMDNWRMTPEGRVGVWGETPHEKGGVEYIRANLAALPPAQPDAPDTLQSQCNGNAPDAVQALVNAAEALHADMLERARTGIDAIHGDQYRIVNAGRTAWHDFDAALAAIRAGGKP